jgi:hypothetical protein
MSDTVAVVPVSPNITASLKEAEIKYDNLEPGLLELVQIQRVGLNI